MSELQVINRNKFPLAGRFDGRDYAFPPGKAIALPRLAANHIFGLGQKDKTRALNCLGLLKVDVPYKDALALLDNVKFEEGRMVYKAAQRQPPEPEPDPEPEPEPPAEPEKSEEAEEGEESEESGGSPGAPRSPGRKSEAEESPTLSASDDLVRRPVPKPVPKRQW